MGMSCLAWDRSSEPLGPTLVRLRQCKGYTQLRVAEALCAASGVGTVTRQEVARWERQECVPSAFWLGWLGVVLEVSVAELRCIRSTAWGM
jgi:transcriptional regulator with XRE-family HTH domain